MNVFVLSGSTRPYGFEDVSATAAIECPELANRPEISLDCL
ncbi:MAG TPA: hypothetical protein VKD19_09000 [Pseudolabrys sp.]|nr:hypothetical protein [Pseudolabrys sp.]